LNVNDPKMIGNCPPSQASSGNNFVLKTCDPSNLLCFLKESVSDIQDASSGQQEDKKITNGTDQSTFDTLRMTAPSTEQSLTNTSRKTYTCEYCGDVLKYRSTFYAHRRRHQNIMTKRYDCTTCESTFSDRSSMRKHMRVHTGEQPFACTLCGTRFSQAGNLRRHERTFHSMNAQS